ncbi:MAG: hypothetical protein HDT28_01175 [Clostridiales bacterium]|nr:hypothetical protein [Clostridiales bacterium]
MRHEMWRGFRLSAERLANMRQKIYKEIVIICFNKSLKHVWQTIAACSFQAALIKTKRQAQVLSFCFGGGGGIRTPVGLHPNGFQVLNTVLHFVISFD